MWFVGYGIFLFDAEDNYNATHQTFLVNDLIIYGFRKFLYEGLLLGVVEDFKPLGT